MRKFSAVLGAAGAMAAAAGCGPLAAPLDQGTEPPVKVVIGGEASQGRPPAALGRADLTVVSGDPRTLGAAGVDVLVSETAVDGFTAVSGTRPYRKKIGGYELAVFGATSPGGDREALLREVRGADADFVLVYLRWPDGGGACPDDDRRSLTGALVEAGADAVVGTGRVQPGGFLADGTGFVHYGLGRPNGGAGGLLTLEVTRNTVHKATWDPSTARGPLRGEPRDDAQRRWTATRTSCPGLAEGPAALRTS